MELSEYGIDVYMNFLVVIIVARLPAVRKSREHVLSLLILLTWVTDEAWNDLDNLIFSIFVKAAI